MKSYSFSIAFILHAGQILCSLGVLSNLPSSIFIFNTPHLRFNSEPRDLTILSRPTRQ